MAEHNQMHYPNNERVQEIIRILMDPKSKVIRRLKVANLLEKVPLIILQCEEWPDFEKYRYQPRSVAHLIAYSERYIDILNKIQADENEANGSKKNALAKLARRKEKIKKVTRKNFDELPDDIQSSSFYYQGNPYIGEYLSVHIKSSFNKKKAERLFAKKTKPVEKAIDNFCRGIKILFEQKGIKPKYALIADIANLFKLSKLPQNYNTIKSRFCRKQI